MRKNSRCLGRFLPRPGAGGNTCPGSLGDQWAQYIRPGPEGAQGVVGYAALSRSLSFSSVSFFSIFDLKMSSGAQRVPWAWVVILSFFLLCFLMFFEFVLICHSLF